MPHVDPKTKVINDNFYVVQDTMSDFFHDIIVPQKLEIEGEDGQYYVKPCPLKASWTVEGGALLLRLISLHVVNMYPSIDTNFALRVSASLATGLGSAIGALVAMFIFKRKTEYTLLGKSAWKSIATIVIPCIVFGIIGGWKL